MQWTDDMPASPSLQTVNKISAMSNTEVDDLRAIVKKQQKTIAELMEAVKKLTEHQLQAGRPMGPEDVTARQAMRCFKCGMYSQRARSCDQPSASARPRFTSQRSSSHRWTRQQVQRS